MARLPDNSRVARWERWAYDILGVNPDHPKVGTLSLAWGPDGPVRVTWESVAYVDIDTANLIMGWSDGEAQ